MFDEKRRCVVHGAGLGLIVWLVTHEQILCTKREWCVWSKGRKDSKPHQVLGKIFCKPHWFQELLDINPQLTCRDNSSQ